MSSTTEDKCCNGLKSTSSSSSWSFLHFESFSSSLHTSLQVDQRSCYMFVLCLSVLL